MVECTRVPVAPILIRRAVESDADAIHKIHVSCIRELCCTHYNQSQILNWAGRQTVERYLHLMNEENHAFMVAEIGGAVVGFANFYDDEENEQMEIKGLYVSPSYGRRGVGTALAKYVEEEAKQRKYRAVVVVATLNAADTFYHAQGFTRTADCTHGVGEYALRAVAMRKQLTT